MCALLAIDGFRFLFSTKFFVFFLPFFGIYLQAVEKGGGGFVSKYTNAAL